MKSKFRDNKQEKNAEILWDEVIYPFIKRAKDDPINSDLKLKSKWKIKYLFIFYFKHYENKILNAYMVNSDRIDRHKISSICIKVINRIKPFKISLSKKINYWINKKEFSEEEVLLNERLSLDIAFKILQSYISYNKNLVFKHSIVIPEPFPKRDENGNIILDEKSNPEKYLKNYASDLYFSSNSEISILTHSNIFFLLEKYGCRKAQCDNLEKKCRELLIKCGEVKVQNKDNLTEEEIIKLDSVINNIRFAIPSENQLIQENQ